jgi:hypothetical protein
MLKENQKLACLKRDAHEEIDAISRKLMQTMAMVDKSTFKCLVTAEA